MSGLYNVEKFKKSLKWILLVLVAFLVVVAYLNLYDLIDQGILTPVDAYLNSLGYNFSIKSPFKLVWNLLLPIAGVVNFVININNENFKAKALEIYDATTIHQLLILMVLLPSLLYLENKFYGRLKDNPN